MKCQDFEKMVIALARQHLLDAAIREPGLTHAEVCVRCARRLLEEQTLLAGVRTVVDEIAEQEAPARVEVALLAAFREHHTAAPVVLPMRSKNRRRSHKLLASIAAGIIILISAVAILWAQSNALTQQHKQEALAPKLPIAPEPQAPSPGAMKPEIIAADVQHSVAANSPRRASRQTRKKHLNEAEVVTEFFPLLEGDDLSSLESGQLVRVELSGSALLAVGLPVDAALANEAVKADLVLGEDGLARAIRFVR